MSPRKKEILFRNKAYRLTARSLRQGDLTAELTSPTCLQITRGEQTRQVQIPPVPQGSVGYRSDIPLLSAMYALAMHELQQDISAEGLLLAGASWHTVWTRDIAYAAALGTNLAAPEATRRSLASRVKDGIILQDTGTGGGWPISTDRVSWAMGAWAYYQSSGDKEWLEFCISALQNTLAQDAEALTCTPLIPGESTFLDWREQSYPDWMTPAQIGASYAFGTNVLHYMARRLLARMLNEAGRKEESASYARQAAELASAIEATFWDSQSGSYHMMCTAEGYHDTRTDALATALAVLCGLAGEHAEQALASLPRSPYGTPVFAPYKSDIPAAYHNRSVWPFAEAYVLLAHAELQDAAGGVTASMAALFRAAMAFGTNKENLHATSGEAEGTLQNSDRQLWSVAGMLGLFYHGLLGIQYEHDSLVFNPCIPECFAGSHWFTGLRIRNMVLDIHLNGYGTDVCSVMINGKAGSPVIPLDTEGHLQVELELMPPDGAPSAQTAPTAQEDLPMPHWDAPNAKAGLLSWHRVPGATRYGIYADGELLATTAKLSYPVEIPPHCSYRSFRLRAMNARKSSVLSAPFEYVAPEARYILHPTLIGEQAEYRVEHQQAWLDTRPCTSTLLYEPLSLPVGTYRLRILYCNATSSLRDGDTCALRELRADGERVGIIPLPHNTEQGHWEEYTYSAPITLHLEAGEHLFSLLYTPACANANRHINQCMVRHLEIIRLG